jgi:hypothetical protein
MNRFGLFRHTGCDRPAQSSSQRTAVSRCRSANILGGRSVGSGQVSSWATGSFSPTPPAGRFRGPTWKSDRNQRHGIAADRRASNGRARAGWSHSDSQSSRGALVLVEAPEHGAGGSKQRMNAAIGDEPNSKTGGERAVSACCCYRLRVAVCSVDPNKDPSCDMMQKKVLQFRENEPAVTCAGADQIWL